MKKWGMLCFLCFVIFLQGNVVCAKSTVVSLYIQDECGKAIRGVEVLVEEKGETISTYQSDQQGKIAFTGLKEGSYEVIIKTPRGYQNHENLDLYISKENQNAQFQLRVTLKKEKSKMQRKVNSVWGLFVSFLNVIAYLFIWVFQKKTIPQLLDDFVL